MKLLRLLGMGLVLWMGTQMSALASCCEDGAPHCVCPITDILSAGVDEATADGSSITSTDAKLIGASKLFTLCMDACFIWPFCFPCLLPMSCCCPTCGLKPKTQHRARKSQGADISSTQPAAMRVEQRRDAAF